MYKLKANPQNPMRITQEFGERPEFYKKRKMKGHGGIDINPILGTPTPIYAVEDGIINIRKGGAYGNRIDLIVKDKGFKASYCHLSRIDVKENEEVKAGQQIGMSGNTSSYEIPIHLHFMIREIDNKTFKTLNKYNGYLGGIEIKYDGDKLICPTLEIKEKPNPMKDLYYNEFHNDFAVSNNPEEFIGQFENDEVGYKLLIFFGRILKEMRDNK